MAQKRYRQGPWPPRTDDQPVGWFLAPDCYQKSTRSVAGPLRLGTAPGVGPTGRADAGNASDFGQDRVSPRGFDPMGTSLERAPRQEASELLAREIRRIR